MAIEHRRPAPGLIFHSDRGTQYTSTEFTDLLADHEITQSLSRPRQCWDNAVAESFFASLKARAHRPALLGDTSPGPPRRVRLHRAVLQPAAAALLARLPHPRRVRSHQDPPPQRRSRGIVRLSGEPGQRHTVRLIGIDAPESGTCEADAATWTLTSLVQDQQVMLTPGGDGEDTDRYGRYLRYVDVNGVDAGLRLIEDGVAIARYDSRDGYGAHGRESAYVSADDASPDFVCAPPTTRHRLRRRLLRHRRRLPLRRRHLRRRLLRRHLP